MNWKDTQDVRKHVQVIAMRFRLHIARDFIFFGYLYVLHYLRVQNEVLFHKKEKKSIFDGNFR